MALETDERAYIVDTAVDILRHRKRRRLLDILGERLRKDDYDDPKERGLDEVAYAVAKAIDDDLESP